MTETTVTHRVLLAVDVEGFSGRTAPMQARLQADMQFILETAAAAAKLNPRSWYRRALGDGIFALLPEEADADRVVVDFIRELNTALREFNDFLEAESRLRLRVALASGASQITGSGWVGQGLLAAARLADAPSLRQALTAFPRANLAVVINQSLYDDLAMRHTPGFQPDAWTRIRIRAKDLDIAAYLNIPGTPTVWRFPNAGAFSNEMRDSAREHTEDVTEPRWFISAPAGANLRPLIASLKERDVKPFVLSDVVRPGKASSRACRKPSLSPIASLLS